MKLSNRAALRHAPKHRLSAWIIGGALLACSVSHLALAVEPAVSASGVTNTSNEAQSLTEVVVTAQKRTERLLSVPAPVTALQAQELDRNESFRIQDFAATAPGLNWLSDRQGENQIILRGISTGQAKSSTTSTYIDESPFGSSNAYALGGTLAPDLDPGVLQRIEVLRGPQGTLYGASSLGGLIKYVTIPPSLTKFSGRVEADGSFVDGGGQGYGFRALVDGPLIEDTLGASISAFGRVDPGYIDDPNLHLKNVNDATDYGGRLALLWRPTDGLSVDFAALLNASYTRASSDEDLNANLTPLYGNLTQKRYILEPFNVRDGLYSATVNYDLEFARLTSITSYQTVYNKWIPDGTSTFGPIVGSIFQIPNLGIAEDSNLNQHKITEELRLASSGNQRLDWQGGFFFTRENSNVVESFTGFDTVTGAPIEFPTAVLEASLIAKYTEEAGFTDLTYHFTPQLDLLAGVRYAANQQTYQQPGGGILLGGTNTINGTSADDSTTYLVAPSYKFNSNSMVYARIASGYRPGGPNAGAPVALGVPSTFKPDTLTNYEIGYKGALPDQHASLEVSAFDIEWKNVQIREYFQGVGETGNGTSARSAGFEVEGTWAPIHGLQLIGNMAYTHAYLTADAPGVNGKDGDELPEVPRLSANLSGDYDFYIAQGLGGFAGFTFSYIGDRESEFVTNSPANYERPVMPAYKTVDLRVGLNRGGLELEAYVKNAGDSHGLNRLSSLELNSYSAPLTASVIQPRTVGFSIAQKF